jgi:glycerol-3-phosphate dehydrogenase
MRGQQTVSSVGPWTDDLGKTISSSWKDILRPTKGVHLTFTRETLPLSSAVVMGTEKRVVFGIPRHEMVIVGTTDTDFSGDPGKVQADAEDIRYLLEVTAKYFPGAKLKAEDIVGSYAGVRPLVRDDSDSEGKTSREHTIFQTDNGVTYIAGGKYTTYRLIAEQVVDRVIQRMSLENQVALQRCMTETQLNPWVSTESQDQKTIYVDEILSKTNWSEHSAGNFFDRHGGESLEILKRLGRGFSVEQAEAFQALENTSCSRLVDFYARRVPFILSLPDHGMSHLPKMTQFFVEYLGWDKQRVEAEQKSLREYLASELHWRDALGRSN